MGMDVGRLARLVAVLSAAVLAASGIAAFVRHVPDVQAELVVRKVAFRLHRPSPTFLQGVASPALRVSSYERATLFGDDIALGPPAADERSPAWRSIAASGSVVVTPAVDGSSIATTLSS